MLDAAQRRDCARTVLLSVAAGAITVAGVAGIAPLLATLADPAIVERNGLLAWLRRALGSPPFDDFLVCLGVGFVAVLVVANLVNLLATLAIGRFSNRVGASFHALLFDEYLRRGVAFHRRSNSDVLATQVVQDVTRTVGGVIQSGLMLVQSLFAIALIATAVVVIDPIVAIGAALTLGASYTVIYAVVRRRLIRDGVAMARLWRARATTIAESFEAIKDVTVFGAQDALAASVAAQSADDRGRAGASGGHREQSEIRARMRHGRRPRRGGAVGLSRGGPRVSGSRISRCSGSQPIGCCRRSSNCSRPSRAFARMRRLSSASPTICAPRGSGRDRRLPPPTRAIGRRGRGARSA